jgi:hypothetical protein
MSTSQGRCSACHGAPTAPGTSPARSPRSSTATASQGGSTSGQSPRTWAAPPGHLVLQLYRDVYRSRGSAELHFEPPDVEIYPSGTEELKLSVAQARALAAVLVELCDAAEA